MVDYHWVHTLTLVAVVVAVDLDPATQELLHPEEEVLYQFQILLAYIQLQLVLVVQIELIMMDLDLVMTVQIVYSQP